MSWPCSNCGMIFPKKKSLVAHRAFNCVPDIAVGQAKREVQDNSIKYTKSTKERNAELMSTLVTKEQMTNLLQYVPSLKTLSKRNYDNSEDLFGCETSSFHNTDGNMDNNSEMDNPAKHFKSMKCGIPHVFKAQIHLLNILSGHPASLKLHDDICKWLNFHGSISEINFKEAMWMSRKQILSKLDDLLSVYGMEPVDKEVRLVSSATFVTVPTFDFKSMVLSLVHDKELMSTDNLIPNFDIFSGKETTVGPEMCGDIHTGDMYKQALERYCTEVGDFPLPIIIFYDKTHTDLHGSLATSPLMFTLGFFNQKARNLVDFWRVLGFVPNLSYGKGKHQKAPSREKLQDQHNCLKSILGSLSIIGKNGGFRTTILGREVTVKPWVHFVIGDASGNNELCGHYNVHGNCSRPYRDCKCSFDNMDLASPQCEYVTENEIRHAFIGNETGSMKELSRHHVDNAFDTNFVPLSDVVHGINGCTPPEGLHTFGSGIFTRVFETLHDIIGLDDSNSTTKDEIDTLHQNVVLKSRRQSERDFPRPSNRNGVMDGTKMGGSERRGNLFMFIVALKTIHGKKLFDAHCKKHGLSKRKLISTVSLLLACEKWCHSNHLRSEVDAADDAFVGLKKMLLNNFPRRKILGEGRGNAWKLPKFHAVSKFTRYMKHFGSATNFNGGPGETNHKKIVKKPAQNTQRVGSSFTRQVAIRNYETIKIELAYSTIRDEVGDFDVEDDDMNEEIETQGRYTVVFDAPLNQRQPADRIFHLKWDDGRKNKLNHHGNEEMMAKISKHMSDSGFRGQFEIRGYTCTKINIDGEGFLFRCSPTYRGTEWYDFCMVNYGDMGQSPALILGFFQYKTSGIPTPHLIECQHSLQDICLQNMADYSIYAVVRSAEKYISFDDISKNFTIDFNLGIGDEYLYIVNVESISGPLLAIPNFGGLKNQFITACPYRQWSDYFSRYIEECTHND